MTWTAIKRDLISIIPAVIFFVIAFNLIYFTEGLMMPPGAPRYYSYLTVTVGAIVAGKFLFLVNFLPFIDLFHDRPLVYNISWKTFIYTFFAFLFRVVEHFVHVSIKFHSVAYASDHVTGELKSSVFWSIQLWLLVLFLIYVTATEFIRKMGADKIRKMFWG